MIKRYFALIIFLFCCNFAFAQYSPAWGGGADEKDLSFGFTFSYVSSYFKILKQPNWQSPFLDPENNNQPVTSRLNSIYSNNSPGFAIGFITRYRLTEHLEVRTTPGLIFADRAISYAYADTANNVTKSVQTTTVDFPLQLKLKSDRVGDFRMYVMGGIKYSYSIGAKKNSDAQQALIDRTVKNAGSYASYETGIGCDIYFEYFKLSPEIKLSNSIGNILVPENQPFSAPINKLSLHTIMFSLYFE